MRLSLLNRIPRKKDKSRVDIEHLNSLLILFINSSNRNLHTCGEVTKTLSASKFLEINTTIKLSMAVTVSYIIAPKQIE